MRYLAIVLCLFVSIPAFADMYSATYTFTDNTARTVATMYAADNNAPTLPTKPIRSVWLAVEGNDARMSFRRECVSGSVGAVLASGSSARFDGEDAYWNGYVCPATSGSNPVVQVIVEY